MPRLNWGSGKLHHGGLGYTNCLPTTATLSSTYQFWGHKVGLDVFIILNEGAWALTVAGDAWNTNCTFHKEKKWIKTQQKPQNAQSECPTLMQVKQLVQFNSCNYSLESFTGDVSQRFHSSTVFKTGMNRTLFTVHMSTNCGGDCGINIYTHIIRWGHRITIRFSV